MVTGTMQPSGRLLGALVETGRLLATFVEINPPVDVPANAITGFDNELLLTFDGSFIGTFT